MGGIFNIERMCVMQFFYVVRSGDTIAEIAKRREIPMNSLITANNLSNPDTISVGQQLSIPPSINRYKVKTGDSLYRISEIYGVPVSVIAEANHLQPPYLLMVGQLLKIPPGVSHYVVQQGDTLDDLAQRYHVKTDGKTNPELIQTINNLSSTTLTEGMELVIPYAPLGDNGFLAYTSNQGGQFDIWVYNTQSGESKQLTTGLGDSFSKPIWSPDSSKIAFVGKDRIIYIIYTATGLIAAIDQLTDGGDFALDWSPDSDRLAYTARGIIVLYDAILHEAENVDQPGASDVNWFPNGKELLFQALDASGISQLFRSPTFGTGREQITENTEGPLHDVRLSPDGKFALYTTPGASISIIHTIELATGKVYEVDGGLEAKNYFPEWSPDSAQIAYSATALESTGYFSQIRTVNRKGKNDQIWAISNCFSTPVTWSPDSRKVAYLTGCGEEEFAHEMWAVDVDHPVPIQLVEGAEIHSLQWSPTAVMDLLKAEYTNETLDVNFQYPSNWRKVNNERYEGADGFFQVSALFGSEMIEEVCHAEAFQELMPYGSTPILSESENINTETCTILPSADQPADMNEQAAYIAKYPNLITIGDATYNYFILWADKNHIEEISSTVMFLP